MLHAGGSAADAAKKAAGDALLAYSGVTRRAQGKGQRCAAIAGAPAATGLEEEQTETPPWPDSVHGPYLHMWRSSRRQGQRSPANYEIYRSPTTPHVIQLIGQASHMPYHARFAHLCPACSLMSIPVCGLPGTSVMSRPWPIPIRRSLAAVSSASTLRCIPRLSQPRQMMTHSRLSPALALYDWATTSLLMHAHD